MKSFFLNADLLYLCENQILASHHTNFIIHNPSKTKITIILIGSWISWIGIY